MPRTLDPADIPDLAEPLPLHGLAGGDPQLWDELVSQVMGIAIVVYETNPPR